MKPGCQLVLLSLITIGCLPTLCGEEMLEELSSPSGAFAATHFERNCGATTGYVYHVNIREHQHQFHTGPQGTITDGEVFVYDRIQGMKFYWQGDMSLIIEYPMKTNQGRIFKQEDKWNGVRISYRAL